MIISYLFSLNLKLFKCKLQKCIILWVLGLRPYSCPICQSKHARTSERSKCVKLHSYEKKNVSEGIVISNALDLENAIKKSMPRPYVCPVCVDSREYTDASCLRRHMRSRHPDYRKDCDKSLNVVSSQDKDLVSMVVIIYVISVI